MPFEKYRSPYAQQTVATMTQRIKSLNIVCRDNENNDIKHRCINFYINKFQIPSPTLRGVAKRPLILADMTFLTRLRSSEIPPLIVLAA